MRLMSETALQLREKQGNLQTEKTRMRKIILLLPEYYQKCTFKAENI